MSKYENIREVEEKVFEIVRFADEGNDKMYGKKAADLIIYLGDKLSHIESEAEAGIRKEYENDFEDGKEIGSLDEKQRILGILEGMKIIKEYDSVSAISFASGYNQALQDIKSKIDK